MRALQTITNLARLLSVPLGSAFLSGCMLFSPAGPTDLSLVSAAETNYRNVPDSELEWIGGGVRRSIPLLKIEFSSQIDLIQFAHKHEFIIYNETTLCPKTDLPIKVSNFSSVFWSTLEVQQYSLASIPCAACSDKDLKQYHIYVAISQLLPDASHPLYDLRRKPEDLCFKILGADILGRSFTSNTVTVSKDLIRQTLQP